MIIRSLSELHRLLVGAGVSVLSVSVEGAGLTLVSDDTEDELRTNLNAAGFVVLDMAFDTFESVMQYGVPSWSVTFEPKGDGK